MLLSAHHFLQYARTTADELEQQALAMPAVHGARAPQAQLSA
jgi:hypothetical protein